MSDKRERMSKTQWLRVWYNQNFPTKTKFHMADNQVDVQASGPMDFYTTGMPKFYGSLAAIILLASYFFIIFYINRLADDMIIVMSLDLLERMNVSAFIAAGGALMCIAYIMLYLQTGTFTKFLTQIEPVIWRDLFKKQTFWTAFRVIRRKRHYPRKRLRRLTNGEVVKQAVLELEEKEEAEEAPLDYALDSLIELQPDLEPIPEFDPLKIEWEEPTNDD